MTDADRHRSIAERAYYRAERRGFRAGSELDDWLDAEREVDATLDPASGNAVPRPFNQDAIIQGEEARASAETLREAASTRDRS